jgi:hypothetical protein
MRFCSALTPTPARGRQQIGPDASPGSRPWRWVLRSGASRVDSFYRPGPEPPPAPPGPGILWPHSPRPNTAPWAPPPPRKAPQSAGNPMQKPSHASALGPFAERFALIKTHFGQRSQVDTTQVDTGAAGRSTRPDLRGRRQVGSARPAGRHGPGLGGSGRVDLFLVQST